MKIPRLKPPRSLQRAASSKERGEAPSPPSPAPAAPEGTWWYVLSTFKADIGGKWYSAKQGDIVQGLTSNVSGVLERAGFIRVAKTWEITDGG